MPGLGWWAVADDVQLRLAEVDDAPAMLAVIQQAFSARPPVDPPAAALSDTVDSVATQLARGYGVIAEVDGVLSGCLLLSGPDDDPAVHGARVMGVHRVSVLPGVRGNGLASALVHGAADLALDLGATHLELLSRREFPQTRDWWLLHGFVQHCEVELGWMLRAALPTCVHVPDAEAMQRLGGWLATVLGAGDVLVLDGELGAGKTTLTQGLGAAMGVSGPIISPTFVLSRIHPPTRPGTPGLVHVDAYRLASAAEVEDLDLEDSLADHVTVVEWGRGVAETLSPDRLEIEIRRPLGSDPTPGLPEAGAGPEAAAGSEHPDNAEGRDVLLMGVGQRWTGVTLDPPAELLRPTPRSATEPMDDAPATPEESR
ncbi:hypothetical protein AESSP_01727 [Aestuariimicrobium sp. T2.26MG-19.2B]|nr:hypothetical protein AESSP_01727 [Aestuariimicrobium sp. T2.26MG-19.2B]